MDKINKITVNNVTYEIGGGGSATVDSGLSATSENAVQNKVITSELDKKLDKSNFQTTLHGVFAKYNNFGGRCKYDDIDEASLHIQRQYTGTTFTSEVTDKEQLCKLVGFTGDTSYASVYTGLYAIFRAKDLYDLKSDFDRGKANKFTVFVFNVPRPTEKPLYDIYQDLGNITLMAGKSYAMPMGMHYEYQDTNLLFYGNPTRITNATFESLYATYSGDTSTMFFADWHDIRNALDTYGCGWRINDDSYNRTIYIYSSSKVRYHNGDEESGYYVKFIDANDFTDKTGNTINLRYNLDYMYGAADLDDMRDDISKIGNLETKVVYAEPDSASTAHTFTKTINGEKLYTTDNSNRDIKLVTSVNGKTGAVNIQAKTINGESVLGEGEIDMSSYQTKTEAVKIARLTQAQYDALSTKDNNTLYIITDAQ